MNNARDYEWGGTMWREDEHGSTTWLGDGQPNGKQEVLLRGSFALVRYTGLDYTDTRLVLLDQGDDTRPNRKLVYELGLAGSPHIDEGPLDFWSMDLAQDSLGMAREGQ